MTSLERLNDRYSREVLMEINNDGYITYVSKNSINVLGYYYYELINTQLAKYLNVDINLCSVDITNGKAIFKSKKGNLIIDINSICIKDCNGNKRGAKISIIDITEYTNKTFVELFSRAKEIIYRYELYPEIKFSYLSPCIVDILGYSY